MDTIRKGRYMNRDICGKVGCEYLSGDYCMDARTLAASVEYCGIREEEIPKKVAVKIEMGYFSTESKSKAHRFVEELAVLAEKYCKGNHCFKFGFETK